MLVFAVKALLLSIVLSLALYYDLKERKIKNLLTFPAAVAGLIINYLDSGSGGLLFAFQGWVCPIVLLFIFYYIKVLGAGDIKLFAAIGAIMGWSFVFYSFIFSVYVGGMIALIILVKRKALQMRFRYFFNYLQAVWVAKNLLLYSTKEDLSAKFSFATAIVPGTMLQLGITVLRIKGVI